MMAPLVGHTNPGTLSSARRLMRAFDSALLRDIGIASKVRDQSWQTWRTLPWVAVSALLVILLGAVAGTVAAFVDDLVGQDSFGVSCPWMTSFPCFVYGVGGQYYNFGGCREEDAHCCVLAVRSMWRLRRVSAVKKDVTNWTIR